MYYIRYYLGLNWFYVLMYDLWNKTYSEQILTCASQPLSLWQNRWNIVMVCMCSVFFPPSLPVSLGLCNRLQRLPLSLSSFSITPCPCAGHQMTSSPPEELSSFFISAAAWHSPGQQPATQREGTSACLRIRDRLAHYPSVSPSDWTPRVTAPLPPCYSRENTGIWNVALFVPYWSERQRGLGLMYCRHDLHQKIVLVGTSSLQHKNPVSTLWQENYYYFNLFWNNYIIATNKSQEYYRLLSSCMEQIISSAVILKWMVL